VPPRVEYSLTRHGESLKPILKLMSAWGNRHRARYGMPAVHMHKPETPANPVETVVQETLTSPLPRLVATGQEGRDNKVLL
jgi:hypothetical protein